MYKFRDLSPLFVALIAGCGVWDGTPNTNDELTSASAVERQLTIKGLVYVDQNASAYTIESAVQRQVRTAFGPLRIAEISVDDRELRKNVDPQTFVSHPVDVVKPDPDGGDPQVVKTVKRVTYTYKARALVAKKHASKTSFSLTLLMGSYQSFVSDIIHDCVQNYEHDSEFASSFWYVFAPGQSACKTRIQNEVTAIESERQGLAEDQIGEKEHGRRFLPVTAQLDPTTPPRTTYPEYDQLLGLDDPTRDRVVVYQIVGIASHAGDPDSERFANDMKFAEALTEIKLLDDQWDGLGVSATSAVDPTRFSFKGKEYTASLQQLYTWCVSRHSFPSDVASEDRDAFRRAIHDHIYRKWITLEVPLEVKSARATKKLTLEIRLLYGTDSGWSVRNYFREAFKNGHVVLYMGHSYIGSGPQDPGNYSASDFPAWYQILFFQSCVSFNYYGRDFFDHKQGGSAKLDLVTNGIESYVRYGGTSMAQFIIAIFDGQPKTWLDILERTRAQTWWELHDPNRSVDGEQDNTYDPSSDPITIQEAGSQPPLTVQNTSSACGQTAGGTIELAAQSEGADRVDFLVDGQQVGSDSQAPFAHAWDSTTVADGAVKITVRAHAADGSTATADCTVTVKNTVADLFFDDMEGGAGGWTATGLWHRTQSGACASPAHASPVSAWYFGQDASCDFDTGSQVQGSLTSAAIAGVSATSKLSFKFFREVEKSSYGAYDATRVEVAEAGSSDWTEVWSMDCKDGSAKAWKSAGPLDLSAWAGRSIQLRFAFDSKDSYANSFVGWMIDDVRVTP
jgi:hypothetical protein